MKRILISAALLALALAALTLGGCAPTESAAHPTDGVWGYVAAAKNAQLEVSGDATTRELLVDRVVAPGDAWIVVHVNDNGKPGMRVGLQHVPAGTSTDVLVSLEDLSANSVIVAVHADKGEPGTFDFSMDAPTKSADRPYFVDRKELAAVVDVR